MHPLQCLLQVLMTLYVIVTFTPSLSIDLYKPEVFTPPPSPVARVAAEVEPREWLELVDKLINLRDTTNSNSCTSLALLPPTPEQSDHPPESQAINGTPPESQALSGILLVAFGIVLGRTGRPGPAGTRKLARTLHRRPRIPKRSDGTPSHRKVTPGSKAGIPLEVDCFATFRQPLQEHVVNQFAIPPTSTTIPAITSPESDQFLTCVTIEPCVLMLEPSRQLEPDAPVSLPSAVESSAVPETNGSITPATPKVEEKLDTANRSHTEDSTSLILPAECFISEAVSAEAVDLVVCRQDEP
ncbi:hypothetical protein K439DRAFT_946416 [Ramaria rubella]|nr:hypothetical protein K439DRAFT_946416 [Ramaria rubella]